jgi:hypothetical protein
VKKKTETTSFHDAIDIGTKQGICIMECFNQSRKKRDGCDIEGCRKRYDPKGEE